MEWTLIRLIMQCAGQGREKGLAGGHSGKGNKDSNVEDLKRRHRMCLHV